MSNIGWTSKEELFPGIWVYRDIFKPEMNLIGRVEDAIADSKGAYQWQEATVGYKEKMKNYRDCFDFKLKKLDYPNKDKHQILFDEVWQDAYDAQAVAVQDYCARYNIVMTYWEAMNFIKYGPGQHFREHADHGYSYNCVVSLVGYVNDDYEGGGLYFNKLGLNIKPKAGDLYIFPSTYLFSHTALPVDSGLKYSLVTMLDYNSYTHGPDFEDLIQKRQKNVQN
jgi:hypothetical protein